jgi:acyl-[acyl carrier protein]--UDP-N-acetylglucosamine O-acyltransferase
MHFASIGPFVRLGRNNIINSRALIEHDCIVGDDCHISTSAVLNGNVTVEHGSLIGSASVLREGIVVGARCIVGMGSNLRHTLPSDTVFTGALLK